MSFTIPKDVVERLNTIFPKSEDRVKIAINFLGYDHDPTRAERTLIGASVGKDVRTVELVLERLVAENLFASDLGSVPLWRINEKERLTRPPAPTASTPTRVKTPAQPSTDEPELPIYPIGVSMERRVISEEKMGAESEVEADGRIEAGMDADGDTMDKRSPASKKKKGVTVDIHSDVPLKELRDIKVRQEGFETVVKAELGGIKELLQKALESKEQPKQETVAVITPVVSPLKGKAKPMEEEDPPEQPANPGPAANPNDPFFNMTKEEVIDFYMNNPQTGRKLPGARAALSLNSE